jgi:hypothetical protein
MQDYKHLKNSCGYYRGFPQQCSIYRHMIDLSNTALPDIDCVFMWRIYSQLEGTAKAL